VTFAATGYDAVARERLAAAVRLAAAELSRRIGGVVDPVPPDQPAATRLPRRP
jgi:hypothetical protein